MQASDFDFELPASSIAQSAIEPRDRSRLLEVDGLIDRRFRDLASMLEPGDLLVVNRTKVRAARLMGTRFGTGGSVEVLLAQRVDHRRWRALLRPARRLGRGTIVTCGDLTVTLLTEPHQGVATVSVTSVGDVDEAIESWGEVPLPPYFKGILEDPLRYQTIFATALGSSAAPTAALHFTDGVVRELTRHDIGIAEVELDVGLDTFRPMADGAIEDHRIHTERIVVPPETVDAIATTRRRGRKVVAVGTTVVRTLETAATVGGLVGSFEGPTDLFITPGYAPRVVDALITNFHAPRTTLIVMVAAFMGDGWRAVYAYALDHGYRFLSFGDAMYLEIER